MTDADGDGRGAAPPRAAVSDPDAEPALDAAVRLAAATFGVRGALLSLSDGDRQVARARTGLSPQDAERAEGFCARVSAGSGEVTVVLDAGADPHGDAPARFCAGTPLVVDGVVVGSLCILDPEPRAGFGPDRGAVLQALGATVEEMLRLRGEAAGRRAAADALDVACRKMALAEELSGVGHWSLEVDSGRVQWSTQVHRIHGVDPETFDPQLGEALDFYEPESRVTVEAHLERTLETGQGFDIKARLVRASDGSVRTVVSRSELTTSNDGGGVALVGVFQDVTEQEALLQQVEADRERYRLLTQNSTDVIATYDLRGVISYMSPAIRRMIGVEADSLIGRRTYEIIHPDDHARIAGEFAAFLQSGAESTRIEYRILPAHGAPLWVEAHPSPMRDAQGRVVGFQDVVRDVSARRQAEHAAGESERRYRLLAENANDMIALTSPRDSTILFVSPGSRRVLGYEPQELVGRGTLGLTHPDDRGGGAPPLRRPPGGGPDGRRGALPVPRPAQGRVVGVAGGPAPPPVRRGRGARRLPGRRPRRQPAQAAGGAAPVGARRRRERHPRQVGLPGQHEPRAAHAAHGRPRLRRRAGGSAGAERRLAPPRRADRPLGPHPAGDGQRRARPVQDRGRGLRPVAPADRPRRPRRGRARRGAAAGRGQGAARSPPPGRPPPRPWSRSTPTGCTRCC